MGNERREQVRDVAVVLSGGAINGVLMELGFRSACVSRRSGTVSAGSSARRRARSQGRWVPSIGSIRSRSSCSSCGSTRSSGRTALAAAVARTVMSTPARDDRQAGRHLTRARGRAARRRPRAGGLRPGRDRDGASDGAQLSRRTRRDTLPEVMAQAILASAAISTLRAAASRRRPDRDPTGRGPGTFRLGTRTTGPRWS